MKILDFLHRQIDIHNIFNSGKNSNIEDLGVNVTNFDFKSGDRLRPFGGEHSSSFRNDNSIKENILFSYPVFVPEHEGKANSCILLLHGLNERKWDKYVSWAEYLAFSTGKPVILFPIAYHINRAPKLWSDPRSMFMLAEKRKKMTGEGKSLSFVNVALSERLSDDPFRFYSSGRETASDVTSLVRQIKNGEHPLFEKGSRVDIFSYSIGSFLAEILLIANPENLFSDTRLFIFCGGSIFKSMNGESRSIMDKIAFDSLLKYYCNEWFDYVKKSVSDGSMQMDNLLSAFNSMILPDVSKDDREAFFDIESDRIEGISLVKDKVMPYSGVEACMGSKIANKCFQLMDFPFDYTHESPFPTSGHIDGKELDASFLSVFKMAAAFLM